MDPVWSDLECQPCSFDAVLEACGDMGREVLEFDWSASPLGPMSEWPASLVSTLSNALASRQPMCVWWGPELVNFHNDGYRPMLGKRAAGATGKPARELWTDVWNDILPLIRQALSGRSVWMEDLPLVMTRHGYDEETNFTFSYSPVRDDNGRIVGMLNTVTETTRNVQDKLALLRVNEELAIEVERTRVALDQRLASEQQQRILQRELAHRMKNTLAMVQAIVAQSIRHATSLEEAVVAVSSRINALAAAQDALMDESWEKASIVDVVATAIRPHADGEHRIVVTGPDVSLTAQQALGLSLAIHELGTNAIKYGALSTDDGRVLIEWDVDQDGSFEFRWTEVNGPQVREPSRRGFGSRLIERIVGSYFSGRGALTYDPRGVHFKLTGRLTAENGPES
jgi:two-component sensor histidine kinase